MSESSNPEIESLLELLGRAQRLESLPRTGWQVCGVDNPESIAAHSYGVALVAMWLADRVDREVDTGRVTLVALVHDFPEAMLTDLPRPVKQLIGAEASEQAEDRAARRAFEPDLDAWRHAHREYREATSLEARIVKAADRIQMLAKALQYRAEYRGRIDRFFEDRSRYHDYGIPLVDEIFDRLFEMYRNDRWTPAGFD